MRTLLAIALVFVTASIAFAQAQRVSVRGTITAFDENVLSVNTPSGVTEVTLSDGYAVRLVVKSELAKIVPGTYVGTAAEPLPDGTLRALEVLIFPEALRGRAEGYGPWDLTPKSTMTNATVQDIAPAVVDKVQGRIMTLKYKDGEKRVFVPLNVPIVTFEPGDKSALVAGAHVVMIGVTKRDDGSLATGAVNVGKDGLMPPM